MSLAPLATRTVRPVLHLTDEDAAKATAAGAAAAPAPIAPVRVMNPGTAEIIERAKQRAGIAHPLSDLQLDIAREGVEGTGHVVIEAVAGSGKSFTLRLLAYVLTLAGPAFRGLAVAFNRSIADELREKMKGTNFWAKTMHGQAFYNLSRAFPAIEFAPNDRKYRDITEAFVAGLAEAKGWKGETGKVKAREAQKALVALASHVRLNLVDPRNLEAVEALAIHHGIEAEGLAEHVADVIAEGNRQAEAGVIDFDDMLYLPLLWRVRFTKFAVILADECQDFNPAQLEVILRSLAPGGRIFFVGDRKQAVYGFAGADHRSFQAIIERSKATVLPLSVTYRCPVSHVRLAQAIVPQIQAAPGAAEGVVRTVRRDDIAKHVQKGDLIMCRTNAPLVALCIELIAQRVQARVKGSDIGGRMISILRKVEVIDGFQFAKLGTYIDLWAKGQIDYLTQKGASDSQVAGVYDMRDALDTCASSFTSARSINDLAAEIEALFADETAAVWLSSVHRAKGLESQQTFILRPELMPLQFPDQQPWELEQEHNLRYVALTRSKGTLNFVLE